MRTEVGIIGAGPAGLMLSHLLAGAGIGSVVLERRSQAEVEATIRAGVLEQGTVDLMEETGIGERMRREGSVHHGISLRFQGRSHRIDLSALTSGKAIMLYAQHEVLRDLIRARLDAGGTLFFSVTDTSVHEIEGPRPRIQFTHDGARAELVCDFIAGCDGGSGIAKRAIPAGRLRVLERHYPFAWFGILAAAPPSSDEILYTNHTRGFALISTRSADIQRLYFQCDPEEEVGNWSEDRIWEELHTRVSGPDFRLKDGKIFQKDIIRMRSLVCEPMQYGRLYLAGDAAHIVPPTGAKGLNLAVADVYMLTQALAAWYQTGRTDLLEGYSARALGRVWRAQHFSWWMTSMLHHFADANPFDHRRQLAELELLTNSHAAQTMLAENYVGLPLG